MIAKVQLIYEDADMNRVIEVETGQAKVTAKTLDIIDRKITKEYKDDAWTRWNLLTFEEDFA